MALTKIYDGTFTHADTTPGAAGSFDIPDTASVGTAGAWLDESADWNISGNLLVGNGNFASGFLTRPTSEGTGDQGITTFTPSTGFPSNTMLPAVVRWSSGNNAYFAAMYPSLSSLTVYKLTAGQAGQIGSTLSYTQTAGHQYSLNFTAIGNVISATISDLTTPSNGPFNFSYTDSSSPFMTGVPGLDMNGEAAVARVQVYQQGSGSSITGVTVTPTPSVVRSGLTQQFAAVVAGANSPSQTVTWSCSGGGSITNAGLYTAPYANNTVQMVTITATASDGSTTGTATAITPKGNVANIVFEGTSLTAGTNASSTATTYPAVASAILGPGWGGPNIAVGGHQITQFNQNPEALAVNGVTNIFMFDGFTNDAGLGGQTAVQTYARLKTYGQARKASNVWNAVVYMTPTPASASGYPANFDDIRDQFLALVYANWQADGICDAIADVASDGRIGKDGCEYDLTYFAADLVHGTDAGYAIRGNYAAAAIAEGLHRGGTATGGTTAAAASVLGLSLPLGTIGQATRGTISLLDGAPLGANQVISLASQGCTVPATVTMPAGALQVVFPLTPVAASFNVTATATGFTSSGAVSGTAIAPTGGNMIDAPTVAAILTIPTLITEVTNLINTQTITLPSGVVAGIPSTTSIPTTGTNPSGLTNYGKGQPLLFQSGVLNGLHQLILASTYSPPSGTNPGITTYIVASFPLPPAVGDTFVIG